MTQAHASPAGRPASGRTMDSFLQANEKVIGLGMLVLAGLFALIPLVNLFWLIRKEPANLPVGLWGMALASSFLFGGLWIRLREPTREIGPIDGLRLALLTVGSLAGLVT